MMRQLNSYKVVTLIGANVLILVGINIGYNIIANENYSYDQIPFFWIGMPSIKDIILERARRDVEYNTSNYNFSQSGVRGLEDLVMETGGRPQRTLIVSTWRSGSSFLADLLYHSVPSTFYIHEPLQMYRVKQFRTPKQGHDALNMVKQILKCNFEALKDYLTKRVIKFGHFERQWKYCKVKKNIELCLNTEVVSWFCKLFPFHNMKVVRLRLHLVEELLDDEELNMKVVLLIRDPRGVMQSRLHEVFCTWSPDCWDPNTLCSDMVSDYETAKRIRQQYPDRLLVIRFEELALQTNKTSVEILKFLKVHKTSNLDKFLQTHTSVDAGGPYTTTRASHNIPFKWKTKLDFQYVSDIQMACTEAMRLWGYKKAYNETYMKSKDFHPVSDYTIS